jgi:Mrp family chromosome partitioning ATPase
LPAGDERVQPVDWLMNSRLGELLARLGEMFDVVVIDTPPAGVFQDAIMLASHADATLFVVRHNFALTEQTKKIIAEFDTTPAPVVGTVLNGLLPRHVQSGLTYRRPDKKYRRHYGLDRLGGPAAAAPVDLPKSDTVVSET